MNKKLLSSVLIFVLSLMFLISGFNVFADTQTIKYEYRLLGDYYEISDGIVEVIDPKGEKIDCTGKDKIYLNWASGSYKFIYPSRTVDVKVYERFPEDIINYAFELEESYDSDETVILPEATIKSTIRRTDGAPKINDYQYSVLLYLEDELLQTFNPKKGEMTYSFKKGGNYKAVYSYRNCFEKEVSKEVEFKVNDVKMINGSIMDTYGIYETLDLQAFYGMYLGTSYPVSLKIEKPNGEIEDIQKTSFYLDEVGSYNLKVSCAFDGEDEITKEFGFDVSTSIQTFVTDAEQMKILSTGNVLGSFITEHEKMVTYNVSNGAYFSYNGIIDLNDFDSEKSLIDIWPNSTAGGNISNITITLTDVYDSSNKLSVYFRCNSDRVGLANSYDNTLVQVQYQTVKTSFSNYGPLKDFSVLWDTTFYNYWCSPEYSSSNRTNSKSSFNIAYDIKDNTLYTYGNLGAQSGDSQGHTGYGLYYLLDLNSASLSEKFKGFRTGEVYLTVYISGYGDVAISSIGGLTQENVSKDAYIENVPFVFDKKSFIPGILGKEYVLPEVIQSRFSTEKPALEVLDPNGEKVEVKANAFIPKLGGIYTLIYSAKNSFGHLYTKEVNVTINETNTPIEIEYDNLSKVLINSKYIVKAPIISGGNGDVSYTLYVNDVKANPGDIIRIKGNTVIKVVAFDQLDNVEIKEFDLDIDTDYIEFKCDMPRTVIGGKSFTIPNAEFYSYKDNKFLEYDVYVNGEKFNESVVNVPADSKNLNIRFESNEFSKEYDILVISESYENISELFGIECSTVTSSLCTDITFNSNDTLKVPFELVPQTMYIDIYILSSDLTYNTLNYTLYSSNGTKVEISLVGLNLEKPKLYVNGEDTGKTVPRIQNIGNDLAPDKYKGKTYYSYSIQYDDVYGIMVDNKPVYSITKDSEGVTFNGFHSPIYLDIKTNEGNEDVTFGLRRIGNQLFIDAAFEFGDITNPIVYSNGLPKQVEKNLGDVLDFSKWFASDALSGISVLKISFYTPDEFALFENEDAKNLGQYELIEIGTYRISVRAIDKNGNVLTDSYMVSIYDKIEPELEIESLETIIVNLGEEASLRDAKASDNESTVKVSVMIVAPDGRTYQFYYGSEVKDLKFKFNIKGTYRIFYIAIDESGNYKTLTYKVEVR